MAIAINGSSNTITGLAVGGLPDGTVDADTLSSNAVTSGKLASGAITRAGLPSGSVIQYKSGVIQDINNRSSVNSSTYASTGIHLDITPTNANNKIIINGRVAAHTDSTQMVYEFRMHNGTSLDSNQEQGIYENSSTNWNMVNIHYEQIAGTTNQMTFTLHHAVTSGSGTAYTGWSSSGGGSATYYNWQYFNAIEVVV